MCTPPDDAGAAAPPAVAEEERRLRTADGAALRTFIAQPATGFRRGAVVIIHDIWGYTDFYKNLARRITGNGQAAALVDFFGRQGELPAAIRNPDRTGRPPEAMAAARQRAEQLTDQRFLADLQSAVDELHARGAARVACWGFCSGGRLAFVSAARVQRLAGAVAYYGFLKGEPGRLSPLDLAGEIHIPVLGIFGGADPGIAAGQIAAFRAALQIDNEIIVYPDTPHAFLRFDAPKYQVAIDDALPRTFRFLSRVLAPT